MHTISHIALATLSFAISARMQCFALLELCPVCHAVFSNQNNSMVWHKFCNRSLSRTQVLYCMHALTCLVCPAHPAALPQCLCHLVPSSARTWEAKVKNQIKSNYSQKSCLKQEHDIYTCICKVRVEITIHHIKVWLYFSFHSDCVGITTRTL